MDLWVYSDPVGGSPRTPWDPPWAMWTPRTPWEGPENLPQWAPNRWMSVEGSVFTATPSGALPVSSRLRPSNVLGGAKMADRSFVQLATDVLSGGQ